MSQYTMTQFVEVCLASKSKEEAAKKLGISTHTVTRVAQNLRKEGVELPPFGRGNRAKAQVDVDALNELIKAKKGA